MNEQHTDLSHWELNNVLSLPDAAILWTGEDPSQPETNSNKYKPVLQAMMEAIESGHLKANIEWDQDAASIKLAVPDWPLTTVDRNELARWAKSQGVVPKFLESTVKKLDSEPVQPPEPAEPEAASRAKVRPTVKRGFMTPEQAAEMLQVEVDTLAKWRSTKRYPDLKYSKIGRKVLYKEEDVKAFIESRQKN